MTKEHIIKDIDFREQCRKYGLDWENFEIYDEVILLSTPVKDLYILFDKNYNTIAIDKLKSDNLLESIADFARRKNYEYSNFDNTLEKVGKFAYPFENFTLKQIVDLSNKIEIMETNHGHSFSIKINEKWYDSKTKGYEIYFQLLSYIKFLGEEIKEYFLIKYHLQVLGFDVPNVYEYVRNLINQINNCIDLCIENNKRPWPIDILEGTGLSYAKSDFTLILYDVIDLLINDKGFRVKSSNPDEIEVFDKQDKKSNLSVLATKLLKM